MGGCGGVELKLGVGNGGFLIELNLGIGKGNWEWGIGGIVDHSKLRTRNRGWNNFRSDNQESRLFDRIPT